MPDNRRTFIKQLGLGAGVLGASGLLLPSEASAFGRRRRACSSGCDSVQVPVKPVRQVQKLDGFIIHYPPAGGSTPADAVTIPGHGLFASWVRIDTALVFTARDLTVREEDGDLIRTVSPTFYAPNRYMYVVLLPDSYHDMPFQLKYQVRIKDVGSPMGFTDVEQTHRWFKFTPAP